MPASDEQSTVPNPAPRLHHLSLELGVVAVWAVLSGSLLSGCATTGQPLQPDHGYPADWPSLVPLSEGLVELNGTYANDGVAVTEDGKRVQISLIDLVPRSMPAGDEADLACEKCVAIRVVPPGRGILSSQKLRFTLPYGWTPRVFDVESVGTVNSTLYVPGGGGDTWVIGHAFSARNVRLTCAADGSLVAQIHDASSAMLLMVIPVASRSGYIWARFERRED